MIQVNNNIKLYSGKHLTYEEIVKIEAFKELEYSNREIVNILNRAPQTINNAVLCGQKKTNINSFSGLFLKTNV